MEEKILKQFKRILGKEVKGLNLIISMPDDFEEEPECVIMEKRDNGKVWDVVCTKKGNIKDYYEL